MPVRQVMALVIPLALIVSMLACGSETEQVSNGQKTESIQGLIRDVRAKSLLELESLTVRDDSGVDWVLAGEGLTSAEFTPSHLRDHMVQGLQVTVVFHRENGLLILDDISD